MAQGPAGFRPWPWVFFALNSHPHSYCPQAGFVLSGQSTVLPNFHLQSVKAAEYSSLSLGILKQISRYVFSLEWCNKNTPLKMLVLKQNLTLFWRNWLQWSVWLISSRWETRWTKLQSQKCLKQSRRFSQAAKNQYSTFFHLLRMALTKETVVAENFIIESWDKSTSLLISGVQPQNVIC